MAFSRCLIGAVKRFRPERALLWTLWRSRQDHSGPFFHYGGLGAQYEGCCVSSVRAAIELVLLVAQRIRKCTVKAATTTTTVGFGNKAGKSRREWKQER